MIIYLDATSKSITGKTNMSSKFVQQVGESYIVVRNYISEDRASKEAEKFRAAYLKEGLEIQRTPDIYTNAIGMYQEVNSLVLLSEKTAELSELLGEAVLPTYAYTRSYFNEGTLDVHTDRDSCEISCTVHLDSDEPWDLQIYNVAGELVDITLHPGDALIFDGVNYKHNRVGEYSGKEYTQAFLHYVFAYGDQSHNYFDIKTNISGEQLLRKYIAKYDKFVPDSVCDGIRNAAIEIGNWEAASISGEEEAGEREYRVCDMIATAPHKELDQIIFTHINRAVIDYCSQHKHLDISLDEGYSILRYQPGGKYDPHTDHGPEHNRAITIILNLNDEYEGGKLTFHDNSYGFDLKKGDVVVFPSSFAYDHCIHPITKGVRYSVVTWAI